MFLLSPIKFDFYFPFTHNQLMLLAKNRRAFYDYEILEKFIAGMQLHGYEVKAIKENKVNMDASYVQIIGQEAFVVNMHIGNYSKQSQDISETETRRSRKLLLHKNEVEKLQRELHQKGKTAAPLALLLEHGLVKLELAIVKGRKKHEKKILEKERQQKLETQRTIKELKKYGF